MFVFSVVYCLEVGGFLPGFCVCRLAGPGVVRRLPLLVAGVVVAVGLAVDVPAGLLLPGLLELQQHSLVDAGT